MNKFAVAVYNNFDCFNKVFILDANDKTCALRSAIVAYTKDEHKKVIAEWLGEIFNYSFERLVEELENCEYSIDVKEIEPPKKNKFILDF